MHFGFLLPVNTPPPPPQAITDFLSTHIVTPRIQNDNGCKMPRTTQAGSRSTLIGSRSVFNRLLIHSCERFHIGEDHPATGQSWQWAALTGFGALGCLLVLRTRESLLPRRSGPSCCEETDRRMPVSCFLSSFYSARNSAAHFQGESSHLS